MMKRIIIALVLLVICVCGLFFMLRPLYRATNPFPEWFLWIDSFDGIIKERIKFTEGQCKIQPGTYKWLQEAKRRGLDPSSEPPTSLSYYYFRVLADDKSEIVIRVDEKVYARAREGMRVSNHHFSSALDGI